MPEGHTIHGLARSMAELVGREVRASSPQGRFEAAAIDQTTITDVQAYGKHLLIDSEADHSVHVHLGMRGKWLRFEPVTGPGLPQVRLRLATGELAWDLIAPSRCELLDQDGRHALVGGLGPDPLRPDGDIDEAYRRISGTNGPIAAALLDQRLIAGVGNVFRAEALHAERIAPTRPAADLLPPEFASLWDTLRRMMLQGVEDGRIVIVDAVDRLAVPEEASRRVYRQASCYDCGTPVVEQTIGGRTSYACRRCQPA